jgi:DNA-binding winged helix-turn-helix (wHTH) protein/tetratricopeptide (TPR) repeat protein
VIHHFGDFELDTELYELRRAGKVQPLEPQVFDVLAYLIAHRDHVVGKDELLENIWPGRIVSDSALTSRLKTARQVIGDTGRAQKLIKTVHGRGYRFVADVDSRETGKAPAKPELSLPEATPSAAPNIVGRDVELAVLEQHAGRAAGDKLELVFVSGEAGLGKTTLMHAFLDRIRASGDTRIAIGQCYERGTTGEAFMPLLDAFAELASGTDRPEVIATLADKAPSWLLQMPWLVNATEFETLERRVIGITRERMLREFAAAVQALCAERLLIIVLEDLHWSDPSTLGLLDWLARRQESIKLMLLGSYRPDDAPGYTAELGETVYGLKLRGLATSMRLSDLDAAAIEAYLEGHFPGCEFPPGLSDELEERIDGSPLFLQSITEAWRDRSIVSADGANWRLNTDRADLLAVMPDNVRLLITDQLGQLAAHKRDMLEAASVAGVRFASALVDAACGSSCEDDLARLAEHGRFIVREEDAKWPDGTPVSQFRFRHALFREVAYASLPAGRRSELHNRIGERLERGYDRRAPECAIELAAHYTAGHDAAKAVDYRLLGAQQAFARGGYREAIAQLDAGLDLLTETPGIPKRAQKELDLRLLLAPALIQTNGWSDPRAEAELERAHQIAAERQSPELSTVLYSLAGVHELRGDYAETEALLAQQRALPEPFADPIAELASRELLACSLFHQGAFEEARSNADAGLAIDDPSGVDRAFYVYGENPRASCHNWAGLSLALMGFPDKARERIEAALEMSRAPVRTYSLSNALSQAATLQQLLGNPERVLEFSEEALTVAAVEGFAYPTAVAEILRGWALTVTGNPADGLAGIERGLGLHAASGAQMDRPYYLGLQAAALLRAGRAAEALEIIDDALEQVRQTRRFFFEPDLFTIKAKIVAATDPSTDPAALETLLETAIDTASEQGNRLAELRARKELVALDTEENVRTSRLVQLRDTLQAFEEGLDLPDFVEAAALTSALA